MVFFNFADDLGSLNPDLYRDESLELAAAAAAAGGGGYEDNYFESAAVRYKLDYVGAKEWLEVK